MVFPLLVALAFVASDPPAPWKLAPGPLRTRWTSDVQPNSPWNVYPRPQFQRDAWTSLNGLWDYAILPTPKDTSDVPSFPEKPDGRILVPYPVESQLSGVGRALAPNQSLLYRRTFELAPPTDGSRVLLHFGAVDWSCAVRVNGDEVGAHQGGYDPFSFDITKKLRAGSNTLVVAVQDPTDTGTQPRGKQVSKPNSIWYTQVSGIWQTVWLETVPAQRIQTFTVETDRKQGTLGLDIALVGDHLDATSLKIAITDPNGGQSAVMTMTSPGATAKPKVMLADIAAWSPENPALYGITVTLSDKAGKEIDRVHSYCAFRDIALVRAGDGPPRLELNGKPYFMLGLLDQGWWPDGLYTAPTHDAMLHDLQVTRSCGFNTIRKHVKVEPAVWYAACDRLGILVWQDMPSGDASIAPTDPDITRTPASVATYERELRAIIDCLRRFPCIVLWVPFNEGWGQFDSARITKLIRGLDPTRLVTTASGWTDRSTGDTLDTHDYAPRLQGHTPESTGGRAWVMGECGGFGLPEPGHLWKDSGWGYTTYKDSDALTTAYEQLAADLLELRADGLCGAIYTQTTDVETELNGVMTYDRDRIKFNSARMLAANRTLATATPARVTPEVVVPNARDAQREGHQAPEWRMTTTKPGEGWNQAFFTDQDWSVVRGGFGSAGTPGTKGVIGTPWTTQDIWLRRTFTLRPDDAMPTHLTVHHDEDAEIWIDGRAVATLPGYTTGFGRVALPAEVIAALKPGNHTLAVHCTQTSGGQFIDVGLCRVPSYTGGS